MNPKSSDSRTGQSAPSQGGEDAGLGKSTSKSLKKALELLRVMAHSEHPLLVAQVAERAQLPRPTAYRLIQTLIDDGFVVRDPVSGRLSVGYEVLPLAARVLDDNKLRLAALERLDELAKNVGERVNLGIVYRAEVMYLGGVEKPSLPTVYSRFGRTVPAYASSLGKAVLAFCPQSEVMETFTNVELRPLTPNTIASLPEFLVELTEVRNRGYAIDAEESARGTFCIGVPVFDREYRPVCAISISARSLDRLENHVGLLRETAERIAHTGTVRGTLA